MNDNLPTAEEVAESSRIHNPAAEVKDALRDFAVTRLKRVEEDAAFADIIKATLRQRMPEATFSELMQLLKVTTEANNQMSDSLANMFQSQNSDKTVIERLEDNSTETAAAKMFAATNDKASIQALTYLSSVLDKMYASSNQKEIDAEVRDVEEKGE